MGYGVTVSLAPPPPLPPHYLTWLEPCDTDRVMYVGAGTVQEDVRKKKAEYNHQLLVVDLPGAIGEWLAYLRTLEYDSIPDYVVRRLSHAL